MHFPINEQNILKKVRHPFLVNISSAFQDKEYLYLLSEYMPYGTLRQYLQLEGLLDEDSLSI